MDSFGNASRGLGIGNSDALDPHVNDAAERIIIHVANRCGGNGFERGELVYLAW